MRGERLRTELLHGPLRRALADPSRVHLPEAASRLAVVADLTIAVLGPLLTLEEIDGVRPLVRDAQNATDLSGLFTTVP